MNRISTALALLICSKSLFFLFVICPTGTAKTAEPDAASSRSKVDYLLGPGDRFRVYQPGLEELDAHEVQVENSGFATFPLVGRLAISGLTVDEVQTVLREKLRTDLISPNPVLIISDYRAHPVSVMGAVKSPGIVQVQRRLKLLDVLTLAGGLSSDAGAYVRVTRSLGAGDLPSRYAKQDVAQELYTAEIPIASLVRGDANAENILIVPNDLIVVARSEIVYVTGDVHKPGGFPLGTENSITAMQALALAEGLSANASPGKTRLFRSTPNSGEYKEVTFDLKQVLAGKTADVQLHAKDVLFVPSSTAKKVGTRTSEAVIQALTGIVIWGRY